MFQNIIITLLLAISFMGKAQVCPTSLFNEIGTGNVYLSFQGGMKFGQSHLPEQYFGINPQIMVSEYVGLNYSFTFGKGYGHIPTFGGGFWSSDVFSAEDDLCVLLAIALIPEGITFYIPAKKNIKIAPYINLMGSELHRGANHEFTETFRGAYNVGCSILYDYHGTLVSPFIEYGGLYNFPIQQVRSGFSIGWIL